MRKRLLVRIARAFLLCSCATARLRPCGWCAFTMAPLASQRLVGGSRRRTATPIRIIDGKLHVFLELLEEECAFKAHLLDAAM